MKKFWIFCLLAAGFAYPAGARQPDDVKTTFQSSREWRPTIDNRADAVMVYGVGGNPFGPLETHLVRRPRRLVARTGLYDPFHDRNRLGRIPGLFHRQVGR